VLAQISLECCWAAEHASSSVCLSGGAQLTWTGGWPGPRTLALSVTLLGQESWISGVVVPSWRHFGAGSEAIWPAPDSRISVYVDFRDFRHRDEAPSSPLVK